MDNIRVTIIISIANVEFARTLSSTIAGLAGQDMWITPLYNKITNDITHYISSGVIDSIFLHLLTNVNDLYSACVNANISTTLSEIQSLINSAHVDTVKDPFIFIDELGLSLSTTII